MRFGFLLVCLPIVLLPGCRSNTAVEGKVKITSTAVFGKNHAVKSPAPKKPVN